MLEADFVIIGSGSAGSAMAYRLSEDGKHSVIVIEFGGSDIEFPFLGSVLAAIRQADERAAVLWR